MRDLYDATRSYQNIEEKSTDPNARGAARMLDTYSCPQHTSFFLTPVLPWKVMADWFPVIRLGDMGICQGPPDMVKEGAATVLVCGLPLARKDDGMAHGGVILQGSPTLIIGGPSFTLPKNISIDSTSMKYQNEVIRDLYFLSTTKNGKALLDRLEASGQPVTIESPDFGPSDAKAGSEADRQAGRPTGTVIKYNPDTSGYLVPGDNGQDVTIPPQVALGHELGHAVRNAEGSGAGDRLWQEAAVVGFPLSPDQERQRKRTWDNNDRTNRRKPGKPVPTENDIRQELGLPKRTAYGGKFRFGGEDPKNFRPGLCNP